MMERQYGNEKSDKKPAYRQESHVIHLEAQELFLQNFPLLSPKILRYFLTGKSKRLKDSEATTSL